MEAFSYVVAAKLVLELVGNSSEDGHQPSSSSSPNTVPLTGEGETIVITISEASVGGKK